MSSWKYYTVVPPALLGGYQCGSRTVGGGLWVLPAVGSWFTWELAGVPLPAELSHLATASADISSFACTLAWRGSNDRAAVALD
jgi:hypothetical protein